MRPANLPPHPVSPSPPCRGIGDGKIFVYNVAKVVKVRTGEQDYAALQDVE